MGQNRGAIRSSLRDMTTGQTLAAGNEAMLDAAFRTGEYDEAEQIFRELMDRARADGDRALEAAVLDRRGMLMHFQALDGDLEKADSAAEEELFQRALAIRRELDDPAGTAESLFGVGLVHQVLREDWDAAMPYYWEALELAEEHGDLLLRSEVHRHVGFYYAMSDLRSDKALEHLRISHELRAALGDPRWIPGGTIALGIAELADGLREQGLAHVREAVRQAHEAGLSEQRIAWMEQFLRNAEAEG
jgi:pentatricopeptide repeat protein